MEAYIDVKSFGKTGGINRQRGFAMNTIPMGEMRPIQIRSTDAIVVIDVQPTFMPGGELPVPDGDAVVDPISSVIPKFTIFALTEDSHPPDHISFASQHGKAPYEAIEVSYGTQVLWPDHAVIGSPTHPTHPAIGPGRAQVLVRKGFRRDIDSYSGFFENDKVTATGLDGYLKARGVKRLFLAGLAYDFCVGYTALDARSLGYEVVILGDATRGVGIPIGEGKTTITAMTDNLRAAGVEFASTQDL